MQSLLQLRGLLPLELGLLTHPPLLLLPAAMTLLLSSLTMADWKMIAIIGTGDLPCWPAEAFKSLLLLLLVLLGANCLVTSGGTSMYE